MLAQSLEEMYPKKCREFKRMVKEYIETVRAPNPSGGAGDKEIGTDQKDIHIHLDDERFPIAP